MLLNAGVALVLSCVLTPLVMVLLRRLRAVDVPTERSSHDRPTLRGGGLAPALAAVVAVVLSSDLTGRARIGVVLATACFGAIGLIEDLVGIPLGSRFLLQVVSALLALPFLLSSLRGSTTWQIAFAAGSLLWITSYVNAFNFMDGIDGISVAQTVVAGTSWYLIGLDQHSHAFAAAGLIAVAVALGFAPFNLPRPLVFLGDVGSYALGAFLASLVLVGLRAGIRPEAIVGPLLLWLADTGSTLARRIRHGDEWYSPHRDHCYQRLVRMGWSHMRTTLTVLAALVACAGAGAATLVTSAAVRVGADLALVALVGAYLALPGWLLRRRRTMPPEPAVDSLRRRDDAERSPLD